MDWCDANITKPNCAMHYTCYSPTSPLLPNYDLGPEYYEDNVPKNYYPQHHCMSTKLVYNQSLPTYGDHRPLWPKFGEYK